MQTFNKFFLALAFLGGSAAAQAADNNQLARAPMNKVNERYDAIERRNSGRLWAHGLTQQATYNGVPVAQKDLSGRFDLQQTSPALFRATAHSPQRYKPLQQKL